jgi:hypothetical protein
MTNLTKHTPQTGLLPINAQAQALAPELQKMVAQKALLSEVGGEKIAACTTPEMRALATKTRQVSHAPSVIPALLKSYTLRRLKEEASDTLWDEMIGTLGAAVAKVGKLYFRANLPADPQEATELFRDIAQIIGANFLQLSVEEITHAFEWALVKNATKYQAYGGLSVQLVSQILGDYRTASNKFLSALDDAEKAALAYVEKQAKIPELNEKAYQSELMRVRDLSLENSVYSCWSACPELWSERLVKEGVITVSAQEKKQLYDKAKALAAAYIFKGLRSPDNRSKASTLFAQQGLVFLQAYEHLPEIYKQKNQPDAGANFEEEYKRTARLFYAKMLYFFCLAPYQSKSINNISQQIQTVLENYGKKEQ